jgi:hypothetical protein
VVPGSTVGDLVRGIALPHELAPLTMITPRFDVRDRVAFWTDRAPAEAVGTAVGAELKRLGFTLEPLASEIIRAVRGGESLYTRVHAAPALSTVNGEPAFPSAPADSIVLEMWVD